MAPHIAGIDKWAAEIRHRMSNDPGRQDLDDHILCNGFLFLDEYLEDILLGARSEPIIELTKTPGRRKDTSKKDRVATAASAKTFKSPDKENIPALQCPQRKRASASLQKALLKKSLEDQPKSFSRSEGSLPNPSVVCGDEQDEQDVAVLITPPPSQGIVTSEFNGAVLSPSLSANVASKPLDPDLGPPSSNAAMANPGVDLSVIAEGDESAILQASLHPIRPTGPIIRDKEISYHIPADPSNPNGALSTVTVSYDPNADDDDDDTNAFPATFDHTFNESEPTSTASSFPIDPYARDYETHELPQMMADHPRGKQPQPHSPQAPTLTRKASVPVFPSLPGPSPLRKSTRDPVNGAVPGSTRPSAAGAAVTGTRTSWLLKARDVTAKRVSVVSGVKRKSGDMTGERDHTMVMDASARATKVAKTDADGGVSNGLFSKERREGKFPIQPFRAIAPPKAKEQSEISVASPDDNSEGMMNMLKRTVEGLGTRVGKSLGKSLGGAAATAAAAEAKAAAEARLAQREAKGSDGTRQGRLSVSDLVGAFETGTAGTGKGQEDSDSKTKVHPSPMLPIPAVSGSRASVTTTPPDSPPTARSQASPGPSAHAIPKFTVQRPIIHELSFGTLESQLSQPSTQSTYVSSVFDNHSTWPQSSFGTEYTASQGFSQPKDYDHEASVVQKAKQGNVSPSDQSVPFEDPAYQFQGLFELEDQTVDEVKSVQHDVDMGDEEGNRDSPSFPSLGTEELKSKVGPGYESSASHVQSGLIAQASTLLSKVMASGVSSALGTSKRGKPEPVKSIQLAAAAAKKQQEEADRKAARLREMDKRRAAIASKKADQDAAEKIKQQGDRHKREREEVPERNARTAAKKVEEEITKKRKVVVELEKKPQGKKPLSKEKKELGSSRIGKLPLSTSLSQSQLASNGASKSLRQPGIPASVSQPSVKLVGASQGEPKATALSKATSSQALDKGIEDDRQPSQTLHAQMQARVEAQMLQARQKESLIPSESIELPDINSEYSNSDDEGRPRTFDPPDWAQSPILGVALQSQSRLNPDDIFGPVKPLRMEEIFTTRHSRFRARTSSANWAGTDELTTDERREYAKRMGYLN